jgi:hypothetical protein
MFVIQLAQSFGQLGQLGQTNPQFTRVSDSGLRLQQQETTLRATFTQLVPDFVTLADANQDIPTELLTLMQKYNRAVANYMEGARLFLVARQGVLTQLPADLQKQQPIAIPTFDVPASGFGFGFGAVGIPARALRIKHGIVGSEITTPLSGYMQFGYAYDLNCASGGISNHGNLGADPLTIIFFVVLGLAVIGLVIKEIIDSIKSDVVTANNSVIKQSDNRVTEVKTDLDLYVSTRDACIKGSDDANVRLACIKETNEALKAFKEGRPGVTKPVLGTGALSIIGIVTILGVAGTVGFLIWRRRQRTTLPEARVHRREATEATEEEAFGWGY